MHVYIVVGCKTQNCRTVHVLMHLGEKGKTPAKVEYWTSYPLMIDCPTCGRTYDHSDSEEKLRSFRLLQLVIPIGWPRHRFKTNQLQKKTEGLLCCALAPAQEIHNDRGQIIGVRLFTFRTFSKTASARSRIPLAHSESQNQTHCGILAKRNSHCGSMTA
jgi:hypothetical protein